MGLVYGTEKRTSSFIGASLSEDEGRAPMTFYLPVLDFQWGAANTSALCTQIWKRLVKKDRIVANNFQ